MQALANGSLEATDRLQTHLDGCLGCRACEPVCPARVPYHLILDAGRARLVEVRPQPGLARWIRVLTHPVSQRLAAWGAWMWRISRLGPWAARQPRLRLLSLLPATPAKRRPKLNAQIDAQALAVWRFGTCVGAALDPDTDRAAAAVLAALGITSTALRGGCCGALAQHAGFSTLAADQSAALARATGGRPIISLASGCAAQLQAHTDVALRAQHHELLAFIRQHWPSDPRCAPLNLRVAIHRPCTHRNALRSDGDIDWLLDQIPGITRVELGPDDACCGAAGHHLLAHPAIADGHLAPKLAAAVRLAPDVIVSSNIGCATHIAGGLRRQGDQTIEVMHPVALLARALSAPH